MIVRGEGETEASCNPGLAYEETGELEKAIDVMQICVDYEKEIGHPDAEEDAARVEEKGNDYTPSPLERKHNK